MAQLETAPKPDFALESSADNLPVIHPGSAEILRTQKIIELYVPLGNVMLHAAMGIGAAPEYAGADVPQHKHSVHEKRTYDAYDNGNNGTVDGRTLFRSPVGGQQHWVPAESTIDRHTVRKPDGGTITAEFRRHVIGGEYAKNVEQTVIRLNPDGTEKDTLIRLGSRDGRFIDGGVKILKPGERARALTDREASEVRDDLVGAFGLKYKEKDDDLIAPLPRKGETHFTVDISAMQAVDGEVSLLRKQGLSGEALRRAVLSEFHSDHGASWTDDEGQPINSDHAFAYAHSLDYGATLERDPVVEVEQSRRPNYDVTVQTDRVKPGYFPSYN